MAWRYWALLILLAVGWGASFFFNEILLRELGPLTVGFGRVFVGAIGCWIWLLATRAPLLIPRAGLGVLLIFALVQYAIPLAVYPVTQQWITSSAAGIVNAMTPVMVVIVSHFWPEGEKMTWAKSIGVGIGFVGITILVWPDFQGQGESDPLALVATMIAPLCYGFALNVLRKLDGMDRISLTAWSLSLGSLALLPIAFGFEGIPQITRLETWVSLAIIGFVLTSAAFILLFWLVPRIGGTTASTITLIAPVSAVLLGVFVLSESLLVLHYVGMVTIFVGLLFIDGRVLRSFRNSQPTG